MVIILFGRRIKYLIPFYKRKKPQKVEYNTTFKEIGKNKHKKKRGKSFRKKDKQKAQNDRREMK